MFIYKGGVVMQSCTKMDTSKLGILAALFFLFGSFLTLIVAISSEETSGEQTCKKKGIELQMQQL